MTTKYKVGQRKVLVVTERVGLFDWNEDYKDVMIAEETEEGHLVSHSIYLYCKEDETFNVGDLIAARCVFVDPGEDWSSWKRIGDRRRNLDYSKL